MNSLRNVMISILHVKQNGSSTTNDPKNINK